MIFDRNNVKEVVALLGAGSMGTAIVRRIAAGKKILLGDISEKALERVGDDFRRSGYDVETMVVNALKKESVEAFAKKAAELGPVMYFIDTAGASPNQANPEHIVDLDMVGTGYAVDAFGEVMEQGGGRTHYLESGCLYVPHSQRHRTATGEHPDRESEGREVRSGSGHEGQRPGLHDCQAHEPSAGATSSSYQLAQPPRSHQHHLAGRYCHPVGL